MRFRISERASVSLLVQRVLPGRRVGDAMREAAQLVTAALAAARVSCARSRAGPRSSRASTPRACGRLPPGRYRVRLLATDLSSGRTSLLIKYFVLRR